MRHFKAVEGYLLILFSKLFFTYSVRTQKMIDLGRTEFLLLCRFCMHCFCEKNKIKCISAQKQTNKQTLQHLLIINNRLRNSVFIFFIMQFATYSYTGVFCRTEKAWAEFGIQWLLILWENDRLLFFDDL